MKIQKGESIPLGYGLVRICWEEYHTYEVLPIPICWIKRFFYWTVNKTKLFDWEKKLVKKQTENWEKIIRILDNLDGIYIRAKVKDSWGSFSLGELVKLGEEKQIIDWIKQVILK